MAPRFQTNSPVNFSCALRCLLTLLRVKLRLMLRMMLRRHDVAHGAARDVAHDARMMLRMMLCVTVPLAHDAAPPVSPNLSCPFLLPTPLVHICVQFGCTRRRFELHKCTWHTTFALASCNFRAGDARAHFPNVTFALKN